MGTPFVPETYLAKMDWETLRLKILALPV